jgi:hypothetical protein
LIIAHIQLADGVTSTVRAGNPIYPRGI